MVLTREQQVAIFVGELPNRLRAAPMIDWSEVPDTVMFGLLFGVASASPERWRMALVAGVLSHDGARRTAVISVISACSRLWDRLAQTLGISDARQMNYHKWENMGRDSAEIQHVGSWIHWYSTAVNRHLAEYLQALDPADRRALDEYVFPELPPRYTERLVQWKREKGEKQKRKRKAQTDILAPIAQVLVALILERRKAVLAFLRWFRDAVAQVERGELQLPEAVVYEGVELHVNGDAPTPIQTRWVERRVRAEFTLWTPQAYVKHVAAGGGLKGEALRARREVVNSKGHRNNAERYFLELRSRAEEGPWFMNALARGALWHDTKVAGHQRQRLKRPEYRMPAGLGRASDLLNRWLRSEREDELRTPFEPEAVYRAALYGTALAVISLTTGARVSELLQISGKRWVVMGPYPIKDQHGEEVFEKVYLQALLPKGYHHDDERKLYNVSAAVDLLIEIAELLQTRGTDSKIPVVDQTRTNRKAEDLKPEPYLFQWGGRALEVAHVNHLIRFMLDGIRFTDVEGNAFNVSVHLLRHVLATVARHEYHLPSEVVAEILHHRHRPGESSEATAYYSQIPRERMIQQAHGQVRAMMDDAELAMRNLVLVDPVEALKALTARCDDQVRDVLEQWHTYHPVTFGLCGWPDLCLRRKVRVLCLGCRHLIPLWTHRRRVEVYQEHYKQMAQQAERDGDVAAALECRRLVGQGDQLLHDMDMLKQAEADGDWTPLYRKALEPGRSAIELNAEVIEG